MKTNTDKKLFNRALDVEAIIDNETKDKLMNEINKDKEIVKSIFRKAYLPEPFIIEADGNKRKLNIGEIVGMSDNEVLTFWKVSRIYEADCDDGGYFVDLERAETYER